MDQAFKNPFIDSINDTYLKELKNKYTGFVGVTCRDIPKNLLELYKNITTEDLKANYQKMNETIDASLVIDT